MSKTDFTSDTPTAPGWYWYHFPDADAFKLMRVEYEADGLLHTVGEYWEKVGDLEGEWLGPLREETVETLPDVTITKDHNRDSIEIDWVTSRM